MKAISSNRRFDTIFYITFQDLKLEAKLDNEEITSMQFTDPNGVLQKHIGSEIWLAPPQFWEISRIANFAKLDDLKTFTVKREYQGCKTWLPVLKIYKDGSLALYPGDDLYPKIPDYEGCDKDIEMSISEDSLHNPKINCGNLNRMIQAGPNDYSILVNIKDPFGHLVPKHARSSTSKGKSKL